MKGFNVHNLLPGKERSLEKGSQRIGRIFYYFLDKRFELWYIPYSRYLQIRISGFNFVDKYWARFDKKDWNKIAGIGEAAAKLFYEKGYIETSIDDIADSLKMTKGGIYHYFKSKNEILYFVLDHYVDLFLQNLEQDLKKIGDPFSKIQFIISRHIDFYYEHLPEGKVLLHEVHCLLPKYFRVIAKKEKKYLDIVAGVLSDYFGKHIPKDQLTVITFCLFGMCNWIYSWYDPRGPVTPQKLAEIIYRIFSVGVRQLNEFKKMMP